MSLEALPNELLFSIAELLCSQRDLNSLTRSSRKLYAHVGTFLYQRNIKSSRASALIWAAEFGREGTAIRALDAGAHIDTKDNHRDRPSALHIACTNGHLNVAIVLLTRNASIQITNSRGLAPLHVACLFKHTPIVELLLNHGAQISMPSRSNETPLHYALRLPKLGRTHNPSPNHKKPPLDSTLSTITLLLAHGAHPLIRDRGGASPESLAKQHLDPEVRALVRHAAASVRCKAEQLDARARERIAREEARERDRLEKERQGRLTKQREEAEVREREEKRRVREWEERSAREREAERRRAEMLVREREMWSRLRESADRRDLGGNLDMLGSRCSSSSFAVTRCGHSSLVWLKRRGKGQCELCSKGCTKHSFQCPECRLVVCTACKVSSSLVLG